jgi:hypothetical protein
MTKTDYTEQEDHFSQPANALFLLQQECGELDYELSADQCSPSFGTDSSGRWVPRNDGTGTSQVNSRVFSRQPDAIGISFVASIENFFFNMCPNAGDASRKGAI